MPRFQLREAIESVTSIRASMAYAKIDERDIRVTWDSEGLWCRIRFAVRSELPAFVVERTERYDAKIHPREDVRDVLWTSARWLRDVARRAAKGEKLSVVCRELRVPGVVL